MRGGVEGGGRGIGWIRARDCGDRGRVE